MAPLQIGFNSFLSVMCVILMQSVLWITTRPITPRQPVAQNAQIIRTQKAQPVITFCNAFVIRDTKVQMEVHARVSTKSTFSIHKTLILK